MDAQPIYLRLPLGLRTVVEKAADDEKVSINEFVVATLSDALAEQISAVGSNDGVRFDVDVTIRKLAACALEGATIYYAKLAAHHGFAREKWPQVRHALYAHLYEVGHECARRGWPMLTALVVNEKSGLPSGGLKRLASQLGVRVTDFNTFVCDERARAFRWAQERFPDTTAQNDDWSDVRGSWKGPPADVLLSWTRGEPDETGGHSP